MDKFEARERIRKIREEIAFHDRKYYIENNPVISDYEYDQLMAELTKLEREFPELVTPDSPTQRVGGAPVKEFRQVRHAAPMLSLDNTYNKDDLEEFDGRIRRLIPGEAFEYVVELKIDGVAASLTYEDGALVTAATRGDGWVGDDITHNARTIKSIPLSIVSPEKLKGKRFNVRGEIYMPVRSFRKLNDERLENGEEPFANPRNATGGSLKQLDPRIAAKRGLSMFVYSLVFEDEPTLFGTHFESLQRLRVMGFPVNEHVKLCRDIHEVVDYCNEWDEKREALDYQIDGMVVKVNDLRMQERLGATGKFPRWAISYKFPAKQATTVVEDIIASVGRTGAITPVAFLKPIQLGGVTISRAAMFNQDEVIRLNVNRGDLVLIERGGEVIPRVVKVAEKRSEGYYKLPENCPACGGMVVREEGEAATRCVNVSCPVQLQKHIEHYASRGAMDIEGLGPEVIELLIKNNLIHDFADLYYLDILQLIPLERMGRKSAENLVKAIQESKQRSLARLYYALGIRNVGSVSAEVLAAEYASLDDLAKASAADLIYFPNLAKITEVKQMKSGKKFKLQFCDGSKLKIVRGQFMLSVQGVGETPKTVIHDIINPLYFQIKEVDDEHREKQKLGKDDLVRRALYMRTEGDKVGIRGPFGLDSPIGPVMAKSIHDFFKEERNRHLIEKLKKAGVKTYEEKKQPAVHVEGIAGKAFVITGTLSIPRAEAEAMIKERGGKVTSSVSKNTECVVAGEDPGLKKISAAKEFGIPIINEEKFKDLLKTKDIKI